MRKQSIARVREEKSNNAHRIVQEAIRNAATATTSNGAIDVLGEALLALDRLLAAKSARTRWSPPARAAA